MNITFEIKSFDELNIYELYKIIQLRIEVFILEQNCPYQDLDSKDIQSFHLFGKNEENEIVCICRILPKGVSYKEISIGRFAVRKNERNKKLAELMMNKSIDFIEKYLNDRTIRISAQEYTEKFYNKFGFISIGEVYLEDNIPHIEMLRN